MIKKRKNSTLNQRLLLLVDFNPEKGGIARVGYMMYQQLVPKKTLSFFGKNKSKDAVIGCKGSFILYYINILFNVVFGKTKEIYCDHLGKASALIFVPNFFISKLVIFLHDEEAWNRTRGRHYLALQKATHLLCNSTYTYQKFTHVHPEFKHKAKVCLLAGVPSIFNQSDHKQNSPFWNWFKEAHRYCIFVSRLWKKHRYKGYLELIDAFTNFYIHNPESEIKLVIIGSGDDENYVLEQIRNSSMQDKIFLFNDVRDKDLVYFYKYCEALVFPSSREGFGYVFLEAMYFKKACIGLKGQPAEEIIEDGKSGILLSDRDCTTIIKVLMDIESNPKKYVLMGERGYEIYQKKFTSQHFNKRFYSAITT